MKSTLTSFIVLLAVAALGVMLTREFSNSQLEGRGILHYEPSKAAGGLNLFTPRTHKSASLFNMKGEKVFEWTAPKSLGNTPWQHIELLDDGSILIIGRKTYVAKMTPENKVLWKTDGIFHHDLEVIEDEQILVLGRKEITIDYKGYQVPIIDDTIVTLNKDGAIQEEISLYEKLGNIIPPQTLDEALNYSFNEHAELKQDSPADIFHSNCIEKIKTAVPGVWREGDILLSLRTFNTLAVLDQDTLEPVWVWGQGILQGQHLPSILPNGNVLVFDNGKDRRYSQILEIDPRNNEVVTRIDEFKNGERFFTSIRGGVQKLPNGNYMIMLANDGEVVEITPEGEVVWKYQNTYRKLSKPKPSKNRNKMKIREQEPIKGFIPDVVYRMDRLFPPYPEELALDS